MAILETLEGDDPEILDNAMPKASAKAWEPDISEILRKRRPKALSSGIPARHRAAGAGKTTSPSRIRTAPRRTGVAGAQRWGAAGRYVVMGDDLDPVCLEGWLTSLKKGVSAVADTASKAVRAVGSVQMDIARSVAPVAGTVIGKAAAAYTGNPTALSSAGVDTGSGGGLLSSLASSLGIGGQSSPAPVVSPSYTPAAVPAASSGIGGIPVLYLAGGAALLLVVLLKK